MSLSSYANKRIVRAYIDEVFNAHMPERASDYMTPDVKWHGGTLGTVQGVENVVGVLRGFIGALPDLQATEHDIVAEGDLVAVRLTVEAKHQGDCLVYRRLDDRCVGAQLTSIASSTGRSMRSGRATT